MSTVTKHLIRDMPDGRRIIATVEYREDDPRGISDAFSATCEVYDPRGEISGAQRHAIGAEWDSAGADDATILEAFPELAPVVALHLANPRTGEPMHGAANAWYFLSAYDGAGVHIYDDRSPREVAASILRVAEIPDYIPTTRDDKTSYPSAFVAFVDAQRERWQAEATAGRELIDSLHDAPFLEDDTERIETWTHSYPHGLRVKAQWTGETAQRFMMDGRLVGNYYEYRVTIHAGAAAHRGSNKYITTFGGSVADYDAGKVDAREAGRRTLAELCEFLDRSANDMAAEFDMDMSSREDRETFRKMERAETAANRLRHVLEPNRDLVA